jgi:AbrB family looped-hinge helix DNA binding protein
MADIRYSFLHGAYHMKITTISDRGQITIPASARRRLGLRPRGRVEVAVRGDEIVLRPVKSISDLAGVFRGRASGATWEEERATTETAVARQVADE